MRATPAHHVPEMPAGASHALKSLALLASMLAGLSWAGHAGAPCGQAEWKSSAVAWLLARHALLADSRLVRLGSALLRLPVASLGMSCYRVQAGTARPQSCWTSSFAAVGLRDRWCLEVTKTCKYPRNSSFTAGCRYVPILHI